MRKELLRKIISLRKELHKNPEIANNEIETAKRILDFFSELSPDNTIRELGGNGLAFVFDSGNPGKTVIYRCDLDGLPIQENKNLLWHSVNAGVSHKCGHDGHMAIMCAFGSSISAERPKKGKAVLLFQPAEETGEGAKRVINDNKFEQIKPDYCFGLHNLPGFKEKSVIIREGVFASASIGMIINLQGKTSHAAEPEKGNSPSKAISKLIPLLENLALNKNMFRGFVLSTIINIKLGERAFGTSPGEAVIMVTLRANNNSDLQLMENLSEGFVKITAKECGLDYSIEFTEVFPATINQKECVQIVKKSAKALKLDCNSTKDPFRWSEDFGHFTALCPSAFFGIGAGENHQGLHHPDYDFPDDIIETGSRVFMEIYKQILR